MGTLPIMAQSEDEEPDAKVSKKEAVELPAVPAALQKAKLVVPAKINTNAKLYFLYKSRSTCAICVAAAPQIIKIQKSMRGKGAELVMLNIDEDVKTAAKWAKQAKMKFPIVAPEDEAALPFPYVVETQSQTTLPLMVVVDAEGRRIDQANGADVPEFLKNWKKMLKAYEKGELGPADESEVE